MSMRTLSSVISIYGDNKDLLSFFEIYKFYFPYTIPFVNTQLIIAAI